MPIPPGAARNFTKSHSRAVSSAECHRARSNAIEPPLIAADRSFTAK
jgi:hypothetical protein